MDNRLNAPWIALRFGIGLTATLAGIDKFFNLLADWGSYVSPIATQVLPVSISTFMGIVASSSSPSASRSWLAGHGSARMWRVRGSSASRRTWSPPASMTLRYATS